jgi:hypothetical protein
MQFCSLASAFRGDNALKSSKMQKAPRACFLRFLQDFNLFVWPSLLIFSAILPSVSVSQILPITSGLIGHYNADSWTGSSWTDLSGAGNHVTDIGGTTGISIARPVGVPAYIYGAPTVWMKFPAGIQLSAEYTLFFVARYNGATRGRIFQGVDTNWLSGFHNGRAGVAYQGNTCGWITSNIDLHGYDWVLGTDRRSSFRSNGVERTTNAGSCVFSGIIAINTGLLTGETSDFAIQSVLVYNRKLTDAEVLRVEAWLTSLQPGFNPANLQARIQIEDCIYNFYHILTIISIRYSFHH